ncbi:hypothetical protein D9M68_951680 [compost metagenome]
MRAGRIGLTVEIISTPMCPCQRFAKGAQQPLQDAIWVASPGRARRQQQAELAAVVFAGHSHVMLPNTAISPAAWVTLAAGNCSR